MLNSNADTTDARWDFHRIVNSRAHEEVIQQITFAILSGAFNAGDRLPNIEALGRLMGVSKPVIGEALKVMAGAGVLRAIRGIHGGVEVTTNDVPDHILAIASPLQHMSVKEIIEARRPVELQLAIYASKRGTPEDFRAMEEAIQKLKAHRRSKLAMRIRFDHQFHYAIGQAARSSALALFQHQILEHIFVRLRDYFAHTEDIESVIRLHEDTLAALITRNEGEIFQAIDAHLQPLEEAFLGAPVR